MNEVGCGLGYKLHLQKEKFTGVLNGIDYDFWNPEIDRYIPHNYNWDYFEQKAYNKKALREELMLDHGDKPMVAYIGRLDNQKGVHLVHHAMYYALSKGAQFVLLGPAR